MADPTRPAQGAVVDPVWGQWVHDQLAGGSGAKQLAYAEKIEDFAIAGAGGIDVPGWEVTFSVATARRVRVELNIRCATGGNGGGLMDFILRQSVNAGFPTNLYVWTMTYNQNGTTDGQTFSTRYTAQPGNHRVWIMANPSGPVSLRAHSSGPMSMAIDDLGPG